LDKALGISPSIVTKRLAKALTWLAIFMPFKHVKDFMYDTFHISVSETCLQDITHKMGVKLFKDSEVKGRRPETVKNESTGKEKTLYLQVDGSMAPIKGDKERDFKEVKLGLAYYDSDIIKKTTKNGKERVEIRNKRFVSSIGEGVENFKRMFFSLAKLKGYYTIPEIVIISDGASWISKMREEYFPKAIYILDWYHVMDHLWKTAYALFGENNIEKCEKWINPLKELLWNGKVEDVIANLTIEGKSRKKNQDPIWQLYGYFSSNKDGMKYDKFRAKGHHIGSGAIESANKYIVANRLKQAGMRWTLSRANSMIWLRCKYFENRWNDFWHSVDLNEYLIDHGETHKVAA
jgi:hypothetical protein